MPDDTSIRIAPVTREEAGDLAVICAPVERDALWKRAIGAKYRWVQERLHTLGIFAWLAYDGTEAVGMIQCHPERGTAETFFIDCLWVPGREHWGRGIGSRLLAAAETAAANGNSWFDGRPADGIAAGAFHGESTGQQSAEDFYRHHGFLPVTGMAGLVFKPLMPGAMWSPPVSGSGRLLLPPHADPHEVVVLLGPLSCPFAYRALRATGSYVAKRLGKPLRILDDSTAPEAFRAYGGQSGVIAEGRLLQHTLLERTALEQEIAQLD